MTTALGLRRLRHQVRYDLLVLVRNREARFFTFALPVLMLVLFVGWGGFFAYCLVRFRRSRNPVANYAGAKSHASSYLEGGVALVDPGVDADPGRQPEPLDPSGLRQKRARILGVKAHLHGVPLRPRNTVLQRFALGDS